MALTDLMFEVSDKRAISLTIEEAESLYKDLHKIFGKFEFNTYPPLYTEHRPNYWYTNTPVVGDINAKAG